ncbi:MAG TPA: DUF4388 domain-containing protein [Thermoanaerobaculia bacterium]|jgi:hypothetical protein|nr:DUF4388 domain-containing protein [Thermoanaerobaculia bacterium]
MAIEGSLEIFQLPEILQMISVQRKTGILTVQGESDIVAISFKDGQVVAADALNQTVEEGLGQILASQGLVSPKDFAAVSAEHEGGGKRLLDLLLEHGHVDRGQLLEALRHQTYRLLLQLLGWQQGEFKFYSGDEVAYEEGFYAISVEELLIRSLSDLGDDGQGSGPPDLAAVYEKVQGGPPIRYLGQDGSVADASGVWIAGEDRPLVERLDGRTTAGAIASDTGVGEYRALFSLYKLLRAGAVRQVAARTGPARPLVAPPQPARATAPSPPARSAPLPAAAPAAPPATRTPAQFPARASAASAAPAPREKREELPEIGHSHAPPAPPAPARGRRVVVPHPSVPPRPSPLSVWVPRIVALAAGVALCFAPAIAPRHLLLPFPWQQHARATLERNQRAAYYMQIDRAARSYFLLEGHYPDGLQELVGLDLLSPRQLYDPAGHRLAYSAEEVSYEVQPIIGGEPVADLGAREAISGDFLLDPDFLDLPERAEKPPLVLLD